MVVRYRFAEPDDADAVAALVTRAWQTAYRGLIPDAALAGLDVTERAATLRSGLPRDVQREQGAVWIVAHDDERILGHVRAYRHADRGELLGLYVEPNAWGRGIGHALHDMALRGLHRVGARSAALRVLAGNQRAITFYERHGWTATGNESDQELFGVEVTGLEMHIDLSADLLERNREYWTGQAPKYAEWQEWTDTVRWGIFGISDEDAGGIFPEVQGRDVIELGCGTAYVSNWARQRGARTVVGLDYTPAQLATAQRWAGDHGVDLPLVQADAHRLPFGDDSFDIAINEYGAAIWCDPRVWIPEAARVLRPGGLLWFLGNSVQLILCAPEFEDQLAGPTLLRAQRDMHRFEWLDTPNIEFHVSHGEMISILTGAGFTVEALHELYAPADTPEGSYGLASGAWASRWPIEEVWVARVPDAH